MTNEEICEHLYRVGEATAVFHRGEIPITEYWMCLWNDFVPYLKFVTPESVINYLGNVHAPIRHELIVYLNFLELQEAKTALELLADPVDPGWPDFYASQRN